MNKKNKSNTWTYEGNTYNVGEYLSNMDQMEIKFRAFYQKDNQMIDWSTLNQSAWNSFRGETPISLVYDVLATRKPEFKTMLFIGLKDFKGCEIYEGDYLQTKGGVKKTVKFIPDKASFCIENLTDFQFEEDWDIWQRFDQKWINQSEAVVIGNIFDNEKK